MACGVHGEVRRHLDRDDRAYRDPQAYVEKACQAYVEDPRTENTEKVDEKTASELQADEALLDVYGPQCRQEFYKPETRNGGIVYLDRITGGILHVYLALFAASTASVAAVGPAYSFTPPKLPKPDFQFTFYQHENLITPTNRTAFAVTVPVAKVDEWTLSDQSWLLEINSSYFGTIVVLEDPLTSEPALNSTQVGFARRIYVFDKNVGSENQQKGIEWIFTAIFNEESGLANRGTLCVKGWDYSRILLAITELAICGGTGRLKGSPESRSPSSTRSRQLLSSTFPSSFNLD
ncbi:hypothetical protein R1sor_011942 [Riccia sorocarpa]|uniref:Dirigent protein n=1 Tax=Riccia sorocarpa TaxID=122646 RepID=A0ABD3I3C1_9MARC